MFKFLSKKTKAPSTKDGIDERLDSLFKDIDKHAGKDIAKVDITYIDGSKIHYSYDRGIHLGDNLD